MSDDLHFHQNICKIKIANSLNMQHEIAYNNIPMKKRHKTMLMSKPMIPKKSIIQNQQQSFTPQIKEQDAIISLKELKQHRRIRKTHTKMRKQR